MAHGLSALLSKRGSVMGCKTEGKTGIGSRRIFAPQFKLQVLDSYRNDADCKGNQRATARKYGIHRRQIQKWLQVEGNLRNSVVKGKSGGEVTATNSEQPVIKCEPEMALRSVGPPEHRQRDDVCAVAYSQLVAEQRWAAAAANGSGGGAPSCPAAYWQHQQQPPPCCLAERRRSCGEPETPRLSPVTSDCDLCSPPLDTSSIKREYPEAQPFLPLDCTTTRKRAPSPSFFPSPESPAIHTDIVPMDLSVKRPYSTDAEYHQQNLFTRLDSPVSTSTVSYPLNSPVDTEVWDLSIKPLKRKYDDSTSASDEQNQRTECSATNPKPVKLFKPYLDNVEENSSNCSNNRSTNSSPSSDRYSISQNNNNTSLTDYNYHPVHQVKTFYCPVQHDIYYDEYGNRFYPYDGSQLYPTKANYMKQRQSYSLDFKLSAIDCYYSDAVCRGNQRAVASKYKIHRRQVQKWLKQEDALRQRNDTTKQPHVVR